MNPSQIQHNRIFITGLETVNTCQMQSSLLKKINGGQHKFCDFGVQLLEAHIDMNTRVISHRDEHQRHRGSRKI